MPILIFRDNYFHFYPFIKYYNSLQKKPNRQFVIYSH